VSKICLEDFKIIEVVLDAPPELTIHERWPLTINERSRLEIVERMQTE